MKPLAWSLVKRQRHRVAFNTGGVSSDPRRLKVRLVGGVVWRTSAADEFVVNPSNATADELMGPNGEGYEAHGTLFWAIERQFAFRTPDARLYVLVQWAADTELIEVACAYRISLFQRQPTIRLIAWHNYDCDV